MLLETRTTLTEVMCQPRMQVFPIAIFGPASTVHTCYLQSMIIDTPLKEGVAGILLGLAFDHLLKGPFLLCMISANPLQ